MRAILGLPSRTARGCARRRLLEVDRRHRCLIVALARDGAAARRRVRAYGPSVRQRTGCARGYRPACRLPWFRLHGERPMCLPASGNPRMAGSGKRRPCWPRCRAPQGAQPFRSAATDENGRGSCPSVFRSAFPPAPSGGSRCESSSRRPSGCGGYSTRRSAGRGWERAAWSPLVDIEETDDAYVIEAELPSVKREDVNIELVGNDLQITGEIKERERTGTVQRRTRRSGRFAYRVTLPTRVDADKIDANLADGVLTVRVPKSERDQRRRIEITS